ncbi:hypothetical protein FRC18_007727 [Serendipita sp. 400]|nr:hypothetical protein FRC18_007727 [Serendipita sp. 400]
MSHQLASTPGSSSQQRMLEEFLKCAICHDMMVHPYTIVDCMHKFDKHCLKEFWTKSDCCPLCKLPATKAAHDFTLQAVVDSTKRVSKDNTLALDNAPIFPSPLVSLGPSRGFDNSLFSDETEDNWNSGDVEMLIEQGNNDVTTRYTFQIAHEPLRPGGNLIFPCNSCTPGNTTGYECPWPIPTPTSDELQLEIARTGRAIRAPGPGEPHAPLNDIDDLPGIMAHLQCDGCSIYVPREFPANIRCTVCRKVYCGEYTGNGNCGGISLFPSDALVYKRNTVTDLAESFPQYVRLNRDEIYRFENYLQTNHITPSAVLKGAVAIKEATYSEEPSEDDQFVTHSQGVLKDNPWTDAILCTVCIETLVRVQAGPWKWWMQERERGLLDPTIKALPDCWYGWECRTQMKSFPAPTHSSKFNHVCPRIFSPLEDR